MVTLVHWRKGGKAVDASKNKPEGLVYIGVKKGKTLIIKENKFKSKNRNFIQKSTVLEVIKIILKLF